MEIFGILQFCISARCPDRCSVGARRLRIRSYFAVELDVNSLTATTHTHADTFMQAFRIMKDMGAPTQTFLVMKLGIWIQIKTEVAPQILSRDSHLRKVIISGNSLSVMM